MDEVLRQRDPELRATVGRVREGEPGAAIAALGNRVREARREELGIEAARRWLALAPEQRADTLILAPRTRSAGRRTRRCGRGSRRKAS